MPNHTRRRSPLTQSLTRCFRYFPMRQFSSFLYASSKVCMHPTRIDLLLSSLDSLSLITELLSHTLTLLLLLSSSALRCLISNFLDSSLLHYIFCFVILSSFGSFPLCLYCSADTHCSALSLHCSLHAVSVVNIDFFLVFSSLPVRSIFTFYPIQVGEHSTRPRGILYVNSCWTFIYLESHFL